MLPYPGEVKLIWLKEPRNLQTYSFSIDDTQKPNTVKFLLKAHINGVSGIVPMFMMLTGRNTIACQYKISLYDNQLQKYLFKNVSTTTAYASRKIKFEINSANSYVLEITNTKPSVLTGKSWLTGKPIFKPWITLNVGLFRNSLQFDEEFTYDQAQ